MDYKLRKALFKDINTCEEIARNSLLYERYFSAPGAISDFLSPCMSSDLGKVYLAVTRTGEAVALMEVLDKGFCGEYHYLGLLCVRDKYRGQGIGSWLLDKFEGMGRESGCRKAALFVSEFNEPAQKLYARHGYYKAGLIRNAVKDGINEFIMLKDL